MHRKILHCALFPSVPCQAFRTSGYREEPVPGGTGGSFPGHLLRWRLPRRYKIPGVPVNDIAESLSYNLFIIYNKYVDNFVCHVFHPCFLNCFWYFQPDGRTGSELRCQSPYNILPRRTGKFSDWCCKDRCCGYRRKGGFWSIPQCVEFFVCHSLSVIFDRDQQGCVRRSNLDGDHTVFRFALKSVKNCIFYHRLQEQRKNLATVGVEIFVHLKGVI